MKKNLFLSYACLSFLLLVFSCKKDNTTSGNGNGSGTRRSIAGGSKF